MTNRTSGYENDNVRAIVDLLEDRYDFHSIMKELFQNADDASSEELHIAFIEHFQQGIHPLLDGPSLIILDDGAFTEENKIGITRIGAGSKTDEKASIGRFGLGMKSIHHICEAFFYVASSDQPASNGNITCDLICPWFEPGIGETLHREWQDVDKAYNYLKKELSTWEHKCQKWFAVIVPLRTKEQLNGIVSLSSHDNRYPLLSDLKKENSFNKLADLLPLMRNLKKINLWDSIKSDSPFTTLNVNKNDQSCRYPNGITVGDQKEIILNISLSDRGALYHQQVFGYEKYIDDNVFLELKENEKWPEVFVFDKFKGRDSIKLLAESHCAVTIKVNKKNSQKAALYVNYAVFLPLSEDILFKEIDGEYDFQILFHGLFFLDSGRRHIFTEDEHFEREVQVKWNGALLDQGVYQLLLPVLDLIRTKSDIPPGAIKNLTKELQSTEIVKNNIMSIGRQYQWFYCIENNLGYGCWKLLDVEDRVFKIPSYSEDISLAFNVFSKLSDIITDKNITYYNFPYISSEYPEDCSDDDELFINLFSQLSNTAFSNPSELNYLILFFNQIGNISIELAKSILKPLFKSMCNITTMQLKKYYPKISKVFQNIPGEVFISVNKKISWENLKLLNGIIDLDILFLPEFILHDSDNELSIDVCETVFSVLERNTILLKTEKSSISFALLDKIEGDLEEKFACLSNYKVFSASEYASNKVKVFSWKELKELYNSNVLFSDKGGSEYLGLLNKTLKSNHFFRINQDNNPFRILFGAEKNPTSDKTSCYDVLLKIPELQGISSRVNLFIKLLGCPKNYDKDNYKKSMRYLIHSEREQFENIWDTMLLQQSSWNEEIKLSRVIKETLHQSNENWRWVPSEVTNIITEENKGNLGIVNINNSFLEKFIRKTGCEWLSEFSLTEIERVTLLKSIEDEDLWKQLPLHKTIDNEEISICHTDNVLLDTDEKYEKSKILLSNITFIKVPKDIEILRKYNNTIESISAQNILRLIMINFHETDIFLDDIMVAFKHVYSTSETLPNNLINTIKNKHWLPTVYGKKNCTEIINLPFIENNIKLIIEEESQPAYLCVSHIDDKVKKVVDAFNYLKEELLETDEAAIEILGLLLEDKDKYNIGRFELNKNRIENLISTFKNLPTDTLPIIEVLSKLYREYGYQVLNSFFDSVNKPLPKSYIKNILLFLKEAHMNIEDLTKQDNITELFELYLYELLNNESFEVIDLKGLFLRNKKGDWVSAEKLGFDAKGISDYCLANSSILKILKTNTKIVNLLSDVVTNGQVYKDFKNEGVLEYFKKLAASTDKCFIAGVLALLGNNDEDLLSLANDLFGRSVEYFREKLNWNNNIPKGNIDDTHGVFSIPKEPILDKKKALKYLMDNHFFEISISGDDERINILNLFGDSFKAKVIEDNFSSIIIGDIKCKKNYTNDTWQHFYKISFRRLNVNHYKKQEISEILKRTILEILVNVYHQETPKIEYALNKASSTEQLQIDVVQSLILRNGQFYLRQLGNLRSSQVMLNTYSDYDYKMAEQMPDQIKFLDKKWANEELDACINSFRELITNNVDNFIEEALNAVKEKILQYQYRLSSIPYELFQNADDAYIELKDMKIETKEKAEFIVHINEDNISFIHHGRPINYFQDFSSGFDSSEGKKNNFHRDLEKMLLLSFSDKGYNNNEVTGKFGLGFKSVYLLCDQPKVISSDNIAFKILGGFFPESLKEEEKEPLIKVTSQYKRELSSTIIYLNSNKDKINESLEDFLNQVPVQLIFSHEISSLIYKNFDTTFCLYFSPKLCSNMRYIYTGLLSFPIDDSQLELKYLLLKKDKTSILFAIDTNKGIVSLPDYIHNIWVTTPLRGEGHGIGFAINGSFSLDVGRSCLAEDQKGKDIEISNNLYTAFDEFIKQIKNWGNFSAELGLNITAYTFFTSLLDALNHTKFKGSRVLYDIVWGNEGFYTCIIKEMAIIPSRLWGMYKKLVSTSNIKKRVTGILAAEEKLFRCLSSTKFSEIYPSGSVIKGTISGVIENVKTFKILDLLDLILENNNEVSSEKIEQLTSIFNDNNSLFTKEEYHTEYQELLERFRILKFKTNVGSFIISTDLVTDKEEFLYEFAPRNNVLSDKYRGKYLQFFRLCKGETDINTKRELIINWGLELKEDKQRIAFLNYVIHKRDAKLEIILKENCGHTWLSKLQIDSELFNNFEDPQKSYILGLTGTSFKEFITEYNRINHLSEEDEPEEDEPEDGDYIELTSSPEEILSNIYNWWKDNKEEQIKSYEGKVYPDGHFFRLENDLQDIKEKKLAWLNFILLGTLQRIGRTKTGTNRNFINESNKNKWLESLIDDKSWNALRCFDSYFNKSINSLKYHQWIYRICDLRVLSINLEDTIEVILNLGNHEFDQTTTLGEMLNTKTSKHYQGGGIKTYPIKPFLGIGSHFVIRELMRNNIINNKCIYQHCYLPVRRVRNIFEVLGCDFSNNGSNYSIDIHTFLVKKLDEEKATFNKCFDIPFHMIADDRKLQEKFGLEKEVNLYAE